MNIYRITYERDQRNYTVDIVHENLLEAVNLAISSYGTKGVIGVQDRGEDLSNTISIERVTGLQHMDMNVIRTRQ